LCVMDVTDQGFEVFELADGVSREQIQERTGTQVHFR
jgi:acyl CoA:acetate/3-ketoacid CoA transferase beta subunit